METEYWKLASGFGAIARNLVPGVMLTKRHGPFGLPFSWQDSSSVRDSSLGRGIDLPIAFRLLAEPLLQVRDRLVDVATVDAREDASNDRCERSPELDHPLQPCRCRPRGLEPMVVGDATPGNPPTHPQRTSGSQADILKVLRPSRLILKASGSATPPRASWSNRWRPAHSILWRFRLGPNPCGPSSPPHRKSPHLYNTATRSIAYWSCHDRRRALSRRRAVNMGPSVAWATGR
jgi:hypothetical protein